MKSEDVRILSIILKRLINNGATQLHIDPTKENWRVYQTKGMRDEPFPNMSSDLENRLRSIIIQISKFDYKRDMGAFSISYSTGEKEKMYGVTVERQNTKKGYHIALFLYESNGQRNDTEFILQIKNI